MSSSGSVRRRRRGLAPRRLFLERLEDRSLLAAVITVNSTGDLDFRDQELTLREAILVNNRSLPIASLSVEEQALVSGIPTNTDTDTIAFNIPSSVPGDVQTIIPTTALPTITDPVIIDGYTQPGASANTLAVGSDAVLLIELDGSLAGGASGLRITAGGSTVQGLVINRFNDGNLFANNDVAIRLDTNGANVIQGNYLGTNTSGTAALGNGNGVLILNSAGNIIGGATPGTRNVISGNDQRALEIATAAGTVVQGNYIGTNAAGSAAILGAVGNHSGVFVSTSPNTRIMGNVISGTQGAGIQIQNTTGSSGIVIQGNRIGTNAAGSAGLGNTRGGIQLDLVDNATIGGTQPGEGNVISDNNFPGVFINGSGNLVQGNIIGRDVTDTVALGNFGGVSLFGSGNMVGGTAAGARNVISHSFGAGVFIGSAGNLVQGNLIRFNQGHGVHFTNSAATNNTIGGTVPGAGNTITQNGGVGVFNAGGRGNSILGNSISSNGPGFGPGGLGIDLGVNGVTPNDAGDGDTGPNNLQNFPVLTSVTSIGGTTTIQGTLNSLANSTFRIELFASNAADPSGFGEGQTFLGSSNVQTDGSGNATIDFSTTTPTGNIFTATATRLDQNPAAAFPAETSEFSATISGSVGAAQTPSVTNAATNEGTQTTSGLVISRNPANGAEVTHFQITGITNGTLFQNNGVTPINDGDFITFAQGNAGLKFTPAAGFSGIGRFNVQASLNNTIPGLGGSIVAANITVIAAGSTDFGDAPDSYRTLLASNGPSHPVSAGLFLGAAIDAENDGQPNSAATGDDLFGVDDDDGVTLPASLVAGLGATATVTASAPGRLDAWIDFNRNGVFEAGEQIAAALPLSAGPNTVTFAAPLNAAAGPTYARFRLSTAGGLAPTGPAADGEVEDYAVGIIRLAAGTAVLINDPVNPGKKVLVVVGTSKKDNIRIQLGPGGTILCRQGCKIAVYSAASVGRIVVLGLDSNDTLRIDPKIKIPLEVVRRRRP